MTLTLSGVGAAHAQPEQSNSNRVAKPPTPDDEIQKKIASLLAEGGALRNSVDAPAEWKEKQAIETKLAESNGAKLMEEETVRKRLAALTQSDPVKKWQAQINVLDSQLRKLQDEQGQRARGIATEIFGARHKSLADRVPAETPQARALNLDVLSFPRIDCSTSAHPLLVLCACRCLGASYEWLPAHLSNAHTEEWPVFLGAYGDRTFAKQPPWEPEYTFQEYTVRAKAGVGQSQRLPAIINGLLTSNVNTHESYLDLIEGRSDAGLLARKPSPEELKAATEKGVELETVPCALDAFVFVVKDSNAVKNLSTDQIRDIYMGKIVNWQNVGGADGRIMAFRREPNSGSQELMIELVMKGLPFANAPGPDLYDLHGMSMSYVALTYQEGGLAYSVYYYEHFMSGSPKTRVIAVDGVEPNYETIRQRQYPYVSEVFIATRKGLDPASPTGKWRAWLLSPEGQSVVAESGYVPISAAAKAAVQQAER